MFLVAYVLMVPFALWALLIQQKRERARPEGKKKGSRVIANVFMFAALLLVALGIERLRHAGGLGRHAPQVNTAVADRDHRRRRAAGRPARSSSGRSWS